MTWHQLVRMVSENAEVTQKDAQRVAKVLFIAIARLAKNGNRITVPDFGTFYACDHKSRRIKNPVSGEAMTLPSMRILKMHSSKNQRRKL